MLLQVAVFQALVEQVARRVHPLADEPAQAERHRDVILTQLAMGAAPLAALPALLASGSLPSGLGVAAFAWAAAPIVVALALTRTGALDAALGSAAVVFGAMAAFAASLTGGLASPALALLLLPLIDAALAGSRPASKWAAAIAGLGATGVAVASIAGRLPSIPFEPAYAIALGVSGAVYALALAARAAGAIGTAERAGQPSDRRFELFAGSLGDLVTRHAKNGSATFVSPAAPDLLGASARELMGQGLFERVHVADRVAFLHALANAADRDEAAAVELRLRRDGDQRSQSFIWVEMQARKVRPHEADAASAAASPVVALFRDVCARKAHEAELVAAREEAERASHAKTRFLAHMSHELRTPLNAIIGFSEVLSDETLMRPSAERRAEYAALIRSSGEHLLGLVNSILDAARLESGAFAVAPRPCALAPIVDQCVSLVALKAQSGGVTISTERAAIVPEVDADPRAVTQIALNLLANAVKFTPRGGRVTIGLAPRGVGVALTVRDTGVGIAPEHISRLGEAFFRAEDGAVREEGTGLGLSVVRGLVALHGGELAVESALGRGTSVTVFLPASGSSAPAIGSTRAPAAPFASAIDEKVKRRA